MKVYCVIPAWNEIKQRKVFVLPKLIEKISEIVDTVVVVDDGSSDQTHEAIQHLHLDLLRHVVNRGQGAALKTGTMHALDNGADIIVHFDADGQFRVEDIEPMIEPIRSNRADIVFGSRFLDDSTNMPYFKKYFIMPLGRLVNRLFFNIKNTDPQSGFRAFNRQAAEEIEWDHDEMAHCSEILINAHRSNLRITEVPITVLYPDFGQGLGGGFKILRDFFLAKLNS